MVLNKVAAFAAAGALLIGMVSHPTGSLKAAAGIVVSYGRPTVVIDRFNNASDTALRFKTHWECITSLSDPNDPFTCTRVAGANASPVQPVGAAAQPNTITGPSICSGTGGTRFYRDSFLGSDCARFIGTGTLYLKGVNWPTGQNNSVGSGASSLSTLNSAGHGDLLCGGTDFPYASLQAYNTIGVCNDNVDWLLSN